MFCPRISRRDQIHNSKNKQIQQIIMYYERLFLVTLRQEAIDQCSVNYRKQILYRYKLPTLALW